MLPLGVVLLLLRQLLYDPQGPHISKGHQLTLKYWSYLKELKSKLYMKPLYRKYEKAITILKDEFETITSTLEDQQRVLIVLADSIEEAESRSCTFNTSVPRKITIEPGREAWVIEQLLHQTEEMLQNFGDMMCQLKELENHHFLCLSIDSDMQQKASFAFSECLR